MMMNILNKVQLPQESVTTGDHKAFSCKGKSYHENLVLFFVYLFALAIILVVIIVLFLCISHKVYYELEGESCSEFFIHTFYIKYIFILTCTYIYME